MATTITGSTSSSSWTHKIVVTENSTNVSNNTSSVTVTAYIGRSSSSSYMYGASITDTISMTGCSNQTITYSNSGTVTIAAGGWLNIGSTTFSSVPHNSDGTKTVTVSSSFTNNVSPSSGSASGNVTLSTIPRASSISCSGGNIGEDTTISVSRYSSSFTHTITYSFGSLTGTIATKSSSTSINWTIPTSFYEQIPNSNTGTGTLTCTTYSGSTTIGTSTCSFKATVTDSDPIFSDFTVTSTQITETPVGIKLEDLTGDNTTVISNYSAISVDISELATAQNGSSMDYYQCETEKSYCDDTTTSVNITVDKYTKDTVTVSAVDTRGNSTQITKELENFIDYEELSKKSMSLSRSDNGVGKFVTLTLSGTFWNGNFGAMDNELTVTYKYKKTSDEEYTDGTTTITPTINENAFSFSNLIAGDTEDNGFEIDDSYNVVVTVSDKINYITYESIIGAGVPAIAIYRNKVALGDKYDTSLGGIQLWGDIYINGVKLEVSE